ncbi:uncharacterized protein [Miscanthus floridulus]|uniref:uncharacterized protein n=1 Tax=Miscanthus floridulus TaxID=154761 RepID=UPI0034597373
MTVVHLLSCSLTSALDGKTSYEAWHRRKPAVSYLLIFGCLVFVKELNHVGKLDDCSSPGVFIGYTEGAKAYRVLGSATRRVRVARDVVFDEGRGWAWDKAVDDGSAAALNDFTVEYAWAGGAEGAQGASSSMTGSSSPAPTSSSAPPRLPSPNPGELGSPSAAVRSSSAAAPTSPAHQLTFTTSSTSSAATPAHAGWPEVEYATPLEDDEDRLDAYYDDEPLRYRTVANILGEQSPPDQPERLFAQLYLTHVGEPTTYAEAQGDPA